MSNTLQVLGAIAILVPFAGSQLGSLSPESRRYLLGNLAGSGVLAGLALAEQQWGFLLLEGCWALVAAWSLGRVVAGWGRVPRS